jgi:hypothetical protein
MPLRPPFTPKRLYAAPLSLSLSVKLFGALDPSLWGQLLEFHPLVRGQARQKSPVLIHQPTKFLRPTASFHVVVNLPQAGLPFRGKGRKSLVGLQDFSLCTWIQLGKSHPLGTCGIRREKEQAITPRGRQPEGYPSSNSRQH